ncbi:MAG: hypothetical protein MK105_19825 [Crocinitomicaceae bacterium]|nr:hypothetical protein [Crocinitomicaceae bacterium]
MKNSKEYIELGIIKPIFEIKRNLNVWKRIADRIEQINNEDKETRKLFSYIQHAAMYQFSLDTCKLYDYPKKESTLCLSNFLKLVKQDDNLRLRKSWQLNVKRDKFSFPESLYHQIKNDESSARQFFYLYYSGKIRSGSVKGKLKPVKFARDKFVAHNELIGAKHNFNPANVQELVDLANEIFEVFNELFLGEIYLANPTDERAYFIEHLFNKLKIS